MHRQPSSRANAHATTRSCRDNSRGGQVPKSALPLALTKSHWEIKAAKTGIRKRHQTHNGGSDPTRTDRLTAKWNPDNVAGNHENATTTMIAAKDVGDSAMNR